MLPPQPRAGWVVEWFKAPVLKTGEGQPSVSSNLTPSATLRFRVTGNKR